MSYGEVLFFGNSFLYAPGHGRLSMADGSYYEGEFKNGEIEGHGYRYYNLTGNMYTGQFHMGELHGQGVMKYSDSSVYEGEWCRNDKEGKSFKFSNCLLYSSNSTIQQLVIKGRFTYNN